MQAQPEGGGGETNAIDQEEGKSPKADAGA